MSSSKFNSSKSAKSKNSKTNRQRTTQSASKLGSRKHKPSKKRQIAGIPAVQSHSDNPLHARYDLETLSQLESGLKPYFKYSPSGDLTLDFSSSDAVFLLNKALLKSHFDIEYWQLPAGALCPPIPGRADYLYHLNDLLKNDERLAKLSKAHSDTLTLLDVGTGANVIYPIIGVRAFNWHFVASDIDRGSIKNAQTIVDQNPLLESSIELRHQSNKRHFFKDIIKPDEYYAATVCNPPFHASEKDATSGSQRKWRNLTKGQALDSHSNKVSVGSESASPQLNFGGHSHELWCQGGESRFIQEMAKESVEFKHQVAWFSTLVSKDENVKPLHQLLSKLGTKSVRIVKMAQGSKQSRFVAWHF